MTNIPGPLTAEEWKTRILQARDAMADVVHRTTVTTSRELSRRVGGAVYLKCENLQRTGSFKIRGAYNRIRLLSDAEREAGVVAASAGNHAQGVALASRLLGARATVYMPSGASITKINATKGYGAEVELVGVSVADALAAAKQHEADTGATFLHPFNHVDVIAGQATVALEILDQTPDVRTIVIPTGGGGMLAGVALAAKLFAPQVRVVGVQAEQAAAYPVSLKTGSPQTLSSVVTMADGIAVPTPGDLTLQLAADCAADVVTVTEADISRTLLWLLERTKMLVEPSAATAVAATVDLAGREQFPMAAVLSGGNIDPQLLMRVIRHGLSGAGRYLRLTVVMEDRPGALWTLLRVLADLGCNVDSVAHGRTGTGLVVNEAEVTIDVETRGPEHKAAVLNGLRAAGYKAHSE